MRIILASKTSIKIMFKKILFTIIFISTQLMADSAVNKDSIIKNLTPFFGKINTNDISKTPFEGVYEVLLRSPIRSVLVSNNGRYLIQGDVIDLNIRQKMSSSAANILKKALISNIDDKDKIIFKAKNEKYIVNAFTDVDCPFCRKLHAEIPAMNKLGITVKYLASPLAQLHPQAQSKMEKIWCAADKAEAMDKYKKYSIIPNSKKCKNPVAAQLKIAAQLGVTGTPAIFLTNGEHIPGYLAANRLLETLENTK